MKKLWIIASIALFASVLTGCVENKNSLQEPLKNSGDIITNISGENVDNIPEILENSGENIDKNLDENSGDKIEVLSGAYSEYNNKTNAWGFTRASDGARPGIYAPYAKVLDENDGIYLGADEPNLYLTFDEGYENGYTGAILDTLKEKEVVATFFVTMPYAKQNPDLIRRMVDEGHIIGNHTVNHPSMPEVLDDEKLASEITRLHDYMVENYNYEMSYLRPPKGEYSERTAKLTKDLGYKTVLWSSAYDDWDTSKQDRLDYARKMILNNLHNGSVMLLHAVSKDNTALLGEVIDEARNRGYEFVSLDEFKR